MATFLQGLAQSLDLSKAANIISSQILAEKERQRQLDEQNKNQELIQNLMTRLNAGGAKQVPQNLDTTPNFGAGMPNLSGIINAPFKQDAPQDKMSIAQQLLNVPGGSKALDDYQQIQKMFQKKNPTPIYDKENKNIWLEDPETKVRTDTGNENPFYEGGQWQKHYDAESPVVQEINPVTKEIRNTNEPNTLNYKPTPKYLADESKFDSKTGKFVDAYGYKDLGGKTVITRKSYIAPTKIKSGMPHISKEADKLLNDYFVQQQKIKANYDALASGKSLTNQYGQPITIKKPVGYLTKDFPVTEEDIQKSLESHQQKYVDMVKQSMPEGLKGWYKELYNYEDLGRGKKAKSNPGQDTFWSSLINSWKNGEISPADLQYGVHLFRATYMTDPLTKYGFQMPQDNIEDNSEDNSEDNLKQ